MRSGGSVEFAPASSPPVKRGAKLADSISDEVHARTMVKRSASAAALANSPNSTRTAILVYDFWEKLAGASLALASAVHLCRLARAALVQPFVESSMLVPFPGAERLPLSAYYSVPHLQKSLAPQQLLSIDEWERRVAAATPSKRTAVVIVWSEFPAACTSALSAATGLARCPSACVKRAEKELASKHKGAWERVKDWPLTCLRAELLRKALRAGAVPYFRRYAAVTLLNWRRSDARRPLLPIGQLQTL